MQEVLIPLPNGNSLAGSVFTPEDRELKGAILVAPATGIKRKFYKPIAQYLAQYGYGTIIFENQGIGDSLVGKVKDSEASLQDWGQVDTPAALKYLMEKFPKTSYHILGHSAGGQMVGLIPEWRKLTSIFNYACSSGNLKNLKFPFIIRGRFFMDVYIPMSNLIFGHTKSQWVGMGEPLPRMVAKQWSQWCNGGGYMKTAFGKTITEHYCDEFDLPAMWVNASDDDIANNANVDDMTAVYPKMQVERLHLIPSERGFKEIGHMKFFSRKSKEKLWPILLEWLGRF